MYVENPTMRPRRIFDEDVEIAALADDPSDDADGLGPDEALTLDETLALGNEAVEVAPVLLTATLPVRS